MKFIILGCGSSMGVPRPDGFFGGCDPKEKKNYRTRCSALIKSNNQNILIDSSPDLRQQLLRHKIKNIDTVLYSHMHADQTHGINDLRTFYILRKKPIDVFADQVTSLYLKKTFSYCFNKTSKIYPAILNLKRVKKNLFINKNNIKINIKSIKVKHGIVESICYIINRKLAYISDVNEIYKKDFCHFLGLDYLIIDCLWNRDEHPSHFNLEKALNIIKLFSPKKAILTNLHTDLDYVKLKKILPKNITPAYDGLTLNL